jgi:hypothetical protein
MGSHTFYSTWEAGNEVWVWLWDRSRSCPKSSLPRTERIMSLCTLATESMWPDDAGEGGQSVPAGRVPKSSSAPRGQNHLICYSRWYAQPLSQGDTKWVRLLCCKTRKKAQLEYSGWLGFVLSICFLCPFQIMVPEPPLPLCNSSHTPEGTALKKFPVETVQPTGMIIPGIKHHDHHVGSPYVLEPGHTEFCVSLGRCHSFTFMTVHSRTRITECLFGFWNWDALQVST